MPNLGSFAFVLHGHLPYVLRHGTWPHGEDWLYEAAAETYLPILNVFDECRFLNGKPRLTMGITPVLLEQLSHDDFKTGFVHYMEDRRDRARDDQKEFTRLGNGHMHYLAKRWEEMFDGLLERFEELDRDIPRAFAERALRPDADGLNPSASGDSGGEGFELLTSNATHAYMPLLLEDSSLMGQMRAGIASSERILGFKPRGMWLPECAYRPQGPWDPPINWGHRDYRMGVEEIIQRAGIQHFFVENHLIESARAEAVYENEQWHRVGWDDAAKYPSRGWRDVHFPHWVNSSGEGLGKAIALARDPIVCEQVWSGDVGYPASGEYMEFHKQWGKRGLRYWKVTGKKTDLGDKHLYQPDDAERRMHEHVSHFINAVKHRLSETRDATGRPGLVVACFDAELFGHWWHEGPRFLRDVMLSMNADPDLELTTVADHLDTTFTDTVVSMPEGSWGDKGDHRVWTNEQVNWMWDIEYRCESTWGRLTNELPWRDGDGAGGLTSAAAGNEAADVNPSAPGDKAAQIHKLLKDAGRELLLLQASDWPFVIRRGQAVDYGIKRYMQHVTRFEVLTDLAEKIAAGSKYLGDLTEVERFEVQDAEIHDVIFPEIDIDWWGL